MEKQSLYERLGSYGGIVAIIDNLLPRAQKDNQLGRFWKNRGRDGLVRERQLLIDYLCASTGGPRLYTGRDMRTTHAGMNISEEDWSAFIGHAGETLAFLQIPPQECHEFSAIVIGLKNDILAP